MRLYKTREQFSKIESGEISPPLYGSICTITDETSHPSYLYDGTNWNTFVTAETDPVTGGRKFSIGGDSIPVTMPLPQMATVVIGNSISTQGQWQAGGYWFPNAEIHQANALAGSPFRWKRVTASTRMDKYCVYGYSGQTLATINSDLEGMVFSTLRTAAVVPDCIVGLSLLENDIAGSATHDQCVSRLTQFIRDCQARYPGAILLLCTPRPSFSYDNAAKVAVYQSVRDYMLSLDDAHSIFVARCDPYENSSSPGTPLGTSGSPIYTDSSVHPNAKGAVLNARRIAATLRRISQVWKTAFSSNSSNPSLSGTGAASGTNVSGTVPTSVAVTGSANATSIVCTAEQPGFLSAWTVPTTAGPEPSDLSSFNFGSLSISGITEISPFIEVEIVSGAENLQAVEVMPRVYDGSGNNFMYAIRNQSGQAQPDWQNGDILTLVTPPHIAVSGSITSVTQYGRVLMKYQGGTTTLRVRNQGVRLVS